MNQIDSETKRLLEAELQEIVERLQTESTIPGSSVVGGDFLVVAQSVEHSTNRR